MRDTIQLLLGDCAEKLREIKDSSIDLVVTSPPYDNLREYKGYQFDFEKIADELVRVLKQGGVIVWVIGDATLDGSESGNSFKQALHFKSLGLKLHDTMIHTKNPVPYDPDCYRYWQAFDYMFVFSKGKPKTCNYLMDLCLNAGKPKTNDYGQRRPDGTLRTDRHDPNRLIKEEKIRQNVWFYTPGNRAKGHPAQFPVQLARDHIHTWSNVNDTVLDPFMGSGTTGVACFDLNRRFIGIEIAPEYHEMARQRIERINASVIEYEEWW